MNRLTHSPSWEASSSTHRSYALGHTYLVKELYNDLRDGRILLRLLELLSGKQFVQDIVVKESDETGEVRHARDALLLWCQLKTAGYPQVINIEYYCNHQLIHKYNQSIFITKV
uniref:Spectrin beta chain, erythrocytic n=1 Tax=Schistosoma haematobium TaxID=6185 RepID=A0A095B009_SCHHA